MKKHFFCLMLALLLMLPCAMAEEIDPAQSYETAQTLFAEGKYWEAYELFDSLGSYEDSKNMARESRTKWQSEQYSLAKEHYKAEDYGKALEIFSTLGNYKDSKRYKNLSEMRFQRAEFVRADKLVDEGKYEEALVIFQSLGRYHTSRERAAETQQMIDERDQLAYEEVCYQKGIELLEKGEYESARDQLILAGSHEGATEGVYEAVYGIARQDITLEAESTFQAEEYYRAMYLYRALGDEDNEKKSEEALREQLLTRADEETEPARARVWYLSLGQEEKAAAVSCTEEDFRTAALEMATACEPLLVPVNCEEADEMIRMNLDFEYALALQKLWKDEEANALLSPMGRYRSADLQINPVTWKIPAVRLRDDNTTELSDVFVAPDGTRHRYQIFKGVHLWVEAKVFCQLKGGHLATLTSQKENQFVYWFMRDSGFLTAFFGLSDEHRCGDWVWVTGEPVDYLNWHRDQPSRSAKERYGMYFYKHLDGTWNDSHFYEDAEVDPGCSFICEWEDGKWAE